MSLPNTPDRESSDTRGEAQPAKRARIRDLLHRTWNWLKMHTRRQRLIPFVPLTVLLAWLLSFLIQRRLLACIPNDASTCESPLQAFTSALRALELSVTDSAIRSAYDVAARIAWQPTLFAFIAIAVGAAIALVIASYRALITGGTTKPRAAGLVSIVAVVALVVGVVSYAEFERYIIRREVLEPLIEAAGAGTSLVQMFERNQRVFQAVIASLTLLVVGAACCSLVVADDGHNNRQKARDLAAQWRCLSLALFCGAMVLVAAIAHQTAAYAWGSAYSHAAGDAEHLRIRKLVAEVDNIRGLDALLQAQTRRDTVAMDTATRRLTRDSVNVVLATSALTLRKALTMLEADSLRSAQASLRRTALISRVNDLASSAITRGGGVAYSILLALLYVPAAAILARRARELSEAENEPAKWRSDNEIAFSFGATWTKILAVLSPLLASGGAIAVLKLLE
jgi:hypothetical protein